jgi:hypothetical protein
MVASSGGRAARLLVAAAAVALAIAAPRGAAAYCRTASCPNGVTGARCDPAMSSDCGVPLYWSKPCVSFDMQQDASAHVPLDVATQIFHQAFATWTTAACPGGGTPHVELVDLGPVPCNRHEYNQTQGNANIIMFRDDSWPHAGQGSTLALTTVTFNLDTGEIYDADMELNSSQVEFTTSDTAVQFDLLSVATHESGHFLGLAHSPVADATMYPDYKPGSTSLRSLTDDDRAAICVAYPPGAAIPSDCDPTPRHGFSSTCAGATPPATTTTSSCCTVAPGAASRDDRAIALLAIALLAMRARRRGR